MDYMTGINTSYADTYDKTSSDLTDKIMVQIFLRHLMMSL